MTSRVYGNVLVIGVVAALAACAGTPSETTSVASVAAAPAAAPAPVAAPAKKPAGTGTGYRLVSKNGQEMYCRKEQTTGSLTRSREVCISKADMESRDHHDQALMQDLKSAPNVTQSSAPPP